MSRALSLGTAAAVSTPTGLTSAEVRRRLSEVGPNTVSEEDSPRADRPRGIPQGDSLMPRAPCLVGVTPEWGLKHVWGTVTHVVGGACCVADERLLESGGTPVRSSKKETTIHGTTSRLHPAAIPDDGRRRGGGSGRRQRGVGPGAGADPEVPRQDPGTRDLHRPWDQPGDSSRDAPGLSDPGQPLLR